MCVIHIDSNDPKEFFMCVCYSGYTLILIVISSHAQGILAVNSDLKQYCIVV